MSTIDTLIPLNSDSIPAIQQTVPPIVINVRDTIINQITTNSSPLTTDHMTMDWDLSVSFWLILLITGMGLAVFFGIAFLKKYILPILKSKFKADKVKILWGRISMMIWLLFGLFSVYLLLKSSIILTSILLVLTFALFHQFFIDFFIGLYFKFEHQIKVNDHFRLDAMEGEIVAFKNRHLQLVNNKQEQLLIPYRNLLKQPIIITKQVENLAQKTIVLTLTGEVGNNLLRLNTLMEMCPWIYNPNHYNITQQENDTYQVTVRAKEIFTFSKIEAYLKDKLGE
ncbi:mechanosensitive ion channel [Putridiphycobacter roseus]|nr:mechanosensitive ion channel [Putridiphycobacter roseus]